MAETYRTPGVYVEEITKFPPSVVPVETAVPAFLGYTRNTQYRGEPLVNQPRRITSLLEFELLFGAAPSIGGFEVAVDADGVPASGVGDPRGMGGTVATAASFTLNHALRHFYMNGGGDCYVVSLGDHSARNASEIADTHTAGLAALALEDEPTLIVMPDLSMMTPVNATNRALYHTVLSTALKQCADLGDRFLIGDILGGDQPGQGEIDEFRNGIGTSNLKYGAVYHPQIRTTIGWPWDESTITVSQGAFRDDSGEIQPPPSPANGRTLAELREGANANPALYGRIRASLDAFSVTLPPGPAIAGAYATVDRTRGVFKAPGNVSLTGVRDLTVKIDKALNDHMNVHSTGKSVNAIREFTGRGTMVWGARTLDGNSNEWRYISVRRFFNMVEESCKKASYPFVFAPNNAATQARVKGMIENFLTNQWRDGALAGATPGEAFFVRVGLGTTMTAQDVLEGRLNVEIGMAVVRPAEFIVLRFSHILPTA
ncbi:phage tail sheath family protein [Marimonas arenosa]|uniref:Tail sheath protein C-terminal domain-containing protein n=1 Tax=Marimonas arenosa TaxID=1795305 RepID=A0AAE3WA58_9RHOB|nr:phage tail sheath C-terminal domain-containing protein [Marimonas arenosa]MDQ2088748.1 hypothetical protein [Marimonas arenosa]